MSPRKKPPTYESAIERLELITEQLEAGEVSLDESIKLYTEGIELARLCTKKLSEAESKIRIIAEKNGLASEEDFHPEETGE